MQTDQVIEEQTQIDTNQEILDQIEVKHSEIEVIEDQKTVEDHQPEHVAINEEEQQVEEPFQQQLLEQTPESTDSPQKLKQLEEQDQEEEGLQNTFETNPVVQDHYLNHQSQEELKVEEPVALSQPTVPKEDSDEELSPSKKFIDPADMPKEIDIKSVEEIVQQKIQMTPEQEAFFDKDNLYPSIKEIEISEEMTEFYLIKRHYLIFTEAGKPVYTRYGDEQVLAPFFASMSAIIPKIQSFFWDNEKDAREQKNRLRWLEAENFQFVVLKKGNFFYICMVNSRDGVQFLDEPPQTQLSRKVLRRSNIKPTSTFIRMQLEYLHLQFVSLMTSTVNAQLTKRPNLDIKTTISGLEKTLDMMCELSNKSPGIFLQAYEPLRMPDHIRKVIEKVVSTNKPASFACGLLITSLNVISVFTDPTQIADMKPQDITVLLNYIYANPSMKNGETWTPICIPGISEDFLLYVYIHFYTPNFGIIIVCTDHTGEVFFECQKAGREIFKELASKNVLTVIDTCTIKQHEQFDMKEIQMVIIKNQQLNQYTTYNYPLLTRQTEFHAEALRVFERQYQMLEGSNYQQKQPRGDSQFIDIKEDYTYVLFNYSSTSTVIKDYSLFICYDHRKNNDITRMTKFLLDDLKKEEKNCFIMRITN